MDPTWVLAGGAAGVVAGLLTPSLVRSLPEPSPTAQAGDPGPKALYSDLARRPGLAVRCAGAGAAAGVLLGGSVASPWPLVLWLLLLPVGLSLAVVDWHTRLLPTRLVRPATLAALVAMATVELLRDEPGRLVSAIVTMLVVRTVFWLLWLLHTGGLGFGDVRLSALLGLLLGHLGLGETVVGLYAGFLLLGVPALVLAVVRRDRSLLRSHVAFGPALLAGAVIGACWGGAVWAGLAGG